MELLSIVFRTTFFYFFIVLAYRIMGKREIGQLGIIDLIVSILIAELVAISIENIKDSIFFTIIPIVLLVVLEILLAFISIKSRTFRNLFGGKPSLIIANGNVNYKEMVRQRYSMDDLLLSLRQNSIKSLDEIEYAFLEPNGKLSIFKYNFLHTKSNYPMPIIVDGTLQEKALTYIKKDKRWLESELAQKNPKIEDVFYAFKKKNQIFLIKKSNINNEKGDQYRDPLVSFDLYDISENTPVLIAKDQISTPLEGVKNLKIVSSPTVTKFYVSGGKEIFEKDTFIPPLKFGTEITFYSDSKNAIKSAVNQLESYPERKTVGIPDSLRNNPDMHKGIWTYLDRVTPDNKRVLLGGRYKLAIVNNPDVKGGYIICYISGSEIDSSFWKEGDIKGYLNPTTFANHYDLIWLDSRRRDCGRNEASATFDGANLLTLDLPLLKSQIRFQRFVDEGK